MTRAVGYHVMIIKNPLVPVVEETRSLKEGVFHFLVARGKWLLKPVYRHRRSTFIGFGIARISLSLIFTANSYTLIYDGVYQTSI